MEYKRFENTLLVRLDQGEEILTQLEAISSAEHILLAEVSLAQSTNLPPAYTTRQKSAFRPTRSEAHMRSYRSPGPSLP